MSKAILFGLNYEYDLNARLFGCINDVNNMAQYLSAGGYKCEVYTDDKNRFATSARGIINRLLSLARETYTQKLTRIWIHFSGHGTQVPDFNRDEKDNYDECIVPSDFRVRGVVTDDTINAIFKQFSPMTKVVCVFDSCHSGTICDLRYGWEGNRLREHENPKCQARAKVISISGCLDNQYSADTWDSVRNMAAGAMTSELLNVLQSSRSSATNAFTLVEQLRINLRRKGYTQVPKLSSSFNLVNEPNI
jgi:hypothetical protein